MVIGAESVAKDCQQSQIMERLHQNRISKCTTNTHQHEKKKKRQQWFVEKCCN